MTQGQGNFPPLTIPVRKRHEDRFILFINLSYGGFIKTMVHSYFGGFFYNSMCSGWSAGAAVSLVMFENYLS